MNKTHICDTAAGLETIRDPMIMVYGDTYYLTGTQPPYWQGENAGMHLWSTKDLKHFTDHGLIVKREDMPEDMWCRDRFWAPELFTDGEKFYATFNCRNESEAHKHDFGVGLAVADRPEGPYTIVTANAPLCDGIDGTIFKDDDGQLYLGANGILPESGKTALFLRKLFREDALFRKYLLKCQKNRFAGPLVHSACRVSAVEQSAPLQRHTLRGVSIGRICHTLEFWRIHVL